MEQFFLAVLNLSIAACWMIPAVLVLRLLMRRDRIPPSLTLILWALVCLRLVCPVTFESVLSLLPSAETISPSIMLSPDPAIHSGSSLIDKAVNPFLQQHFSPDPMTSANPLQILIPVLAVIWLCGMAVLALCSLVSYLTLRKRLAHAIPVQEHICRSDRIDTPFLLGYFPPRIYLPARLPEQLLPSILAHEENHIRFHDHWWKLFGWLIVILHWFNPLVWLCWHLFCRDLESACDGRTVREMSREQRADYAEALLSCSLRPSFHSPLAFGEQAVKQRIRSVLTYRKPTLPVILIGILACVVLAVCFLSAPKQVRFDVTVTIPAHADYGTFYSEEELSPLSDHVDISVDHDLGDCSVSLLPVQVQKELAYADAESYATPGMIVQLEAERGGWFRLGVYTSNPSDQPKTVRISVRPVTHRISSALYTDYVGDAPAVVEIAQSLPYPEGWQYDSIEIQSREEPYGLTVYVTGQGEGDFSPCGAACFDSIGNLGTVSFCRKDGTVLASFYPDGVISEQNSSSD